jgi:hypothetical protein
MPPVQHKDSESTLENPFMSTTTSGRQVAGQITAYATLVLSAQYCTHVFSILIIKNFTRLIRWDRGGAVVTAPIYYNDESFLLDFLIRYSNTNPEVRGHDVTVSFPTDDDARDAQTLPDLASAKSLLVITMPDPHQPQETSHYVICGPCARLDIPAGRWTWVSIAYDIQWKKHVLLKDSWRVLLNDITPEGEVYVKLHQHSVPNIPHCSHAGDVGGNTYHTSRTHEFVGKCKPHIPLPITPHNHYHLILDTIGQKLEDFSCSWEMANTVHASLVSKLANF